MKRYISLILAVMMALSLTACQGGNAESSTALGQSGVVEEESGAEETTGREFGYRSISLGPVDESKFNGQLRLNGRAYILEWEDEVEYLPVPATLEDIADQGYDIVLRKHNMEKPSVFGLDSEKPGVNGTDIYFYKSDREEKDSWKFDGTIIDLEDEGITIGEAVERSWWCLSENSERGVVVGDLIDADESDERFADPGESQQGFLLDTLGQPSMVIITYEVDDDDAELRSSYYSLAYEYEDYTLRFNFNEHIHEKYHSQEMYGITYYPSEYWQALLPRYTSEYDVITA